MRSLTTILSEVLSISEDTITDQTSPDTVPSWDSFNGLMLVSELEREYGVQFTTQEVVSVSNVADIKKILLQHNVSADAYDA